MGSYEILAAIGAGDMGEVCRAVAIKRATAKVEPSKTAQRKNRSG
jgi:hypothetical protein